MAKKSKPQSRVSVARSKKPAPPAVENPVGGSRFFRRPLSEIPKADDEPPRDLVDSSRVIMRGEVEEMKQREFNFHLIGAGEQIAERVCLDAMDVEGNGIRVLGDFYENKRVIRIEGSYPGWRLVRSISADQATEMVENICIFLEACGDLQMKK